MLIGEFSVVSSFSEVHVFRVCKGCHCRRGHSHPPGPLPRPRRSRGPWVSCSLGSPPSPKPQGSLSLEMVITAETLSWDQVAVPTAWPSPELEVKTDSWRCVWSLASSRPTRPAGWRGSPASCERGAPGSPGALVSPLFTGLLPTSGVFSH